MAFEEEVGKEKLSGKSGAKTQIMTLQKAVDLGEYDPEYLKTFPEWHTLGRHVQLQFIREGLDNRRKQLLIQWAEMDRAIDYRLKPHLQVAQRNVEKQLKKIEEDRERLYSEYSR